MCVLLLPRRVTTIRLVRARSLLFFFWRACRQTLADTRTHSHTEEPLAGADSLTRTATQDRGGPSCLSFPKERGKKRQEPAKKKKKKEKRRVFSPQLFCFHRELAHATEKARVGQPRRPFFFTSACVFSALLCVVGRCAWRGVSFLSSKSSLWRAGRLGRRRADRSQRFFREKKKRTALVVARRQTLDEDRLKERYSPANTSTRTHTHTRNIH